MRLADVFVAVRADMTDVNQAFRGLESSLGGVQKSLGNMGRSLTTNVTLPILAVGGATSKMALDFERTMGQLVGLADVGAGSINGIREEVLQLARDTGRGPQELADAFYFVASAGFEAEEAMEVLETAARASAAGMGEVQSVAQVLGGIINSYGRENIDAARAADILTAAVTEGSAEANKFAQVLPTVVPTAAQLGVSFEQVAGAIAAITTTGSNAEMAAVGLNQVFTNMLKPTAEAKEALAGVGLTMEELRRQLAEEGVVAVLRTLDTAFQGNVESMGDVFGNVRSLRAAFALLNVDAAQLDEIMLNVADSAGANAAAFKAVPPDVLAMDKAIADMQATAIELGKDTLPLVSQILTRVAEVIRSGVNWWKRQSDETKQTIINFALFAAAAGPVLTILSKLVGVVKFAVAGVRGLVIAGRLLHTAWLNIPTVIGYAELALGKAVVAFAAVRTAAMGLASALAGPIGIAIGAFALGMQTDFLGMRTRFERDMKDMGDAANRFAMNFGDQGDETQRVADRFGLNIDELRDRVNRQMSRMGVDFDTALGDVTRSLEGTRPSLRQSAQSWEEYQHIVSMSVEGMLNSTKTVVGEFETATGEMVTVFEDGSTAINGEMSEMTEEQIKAAEDMRKAVVESMSNMLAGMAALFDSDDQVQQAFQDLLDRMDDPYTDAELRADIFSKDLLATISGALKSGSTGLVADTTTMVNDMLRQIETLQPGALAVGKGVPPAIRGGMDSQMTALIAWIEENVTHEAITALTLDEATEIGIDGIYRYALGMRSNSMRAEAEARYVAGRAKIALEDPDYYGSGAGASVDYGRGIDSGEGYARQQAREVANSALTETFNRDWYGAGYRVGVAWANGLRGARDYARLMAWELAASTNPALHGLSPPKEGPLSDIDKGGYNIGVAWANALGSAAALAKSQAFRLAGAANSALSGGMGQMALAAPAFAPLSGLAPGGMSSVAGDTYILQVDGKEKVVGSRDDVLDAWQQMASFGGKR